MRVEFTRDNNYTVGVVVKETDEENTYLAFRAPREHESEVLEKLAESFIQYEQEENSIEKPLEEEPQA